jgi:tetratricopeptide (TPR) repeat protein
LKRIIKILITLSLGCALLSTNTFAQDLDVVKSAIESEQFRKATQLVKPLLKAAGSNGDAYFYLGSIYLKTNQPDSAKDIFTKGSVEFKKNPLNFVGLGHVALLAGNAVGAKDYFDLAIKVSKRKDFLPQLYIGQAYMDSNTSNLAPAMVHLKIADEIDKKDTSADIYTSYGDYYAQQKKPTEALKNYAKALVLNPELLKAKVRTAQVYSDGAEFNKTDSILKAITLKYPTYGPAFKARSAVHQLWPSVGDVHQNHAALAAEYYKSYLNITGDYYTFHVKYATLLYAANDFLKLNEELRYLQGAEFKSNNEVTVDRLSAYTAFENKNYTAALQSFDKYLANIKDHTLINSDDYLYLGRTQLKLGQEDKAVYNISKAVELDQTKSSFLAEIARFYYDKKNWTKAIAFYEKASTVANLPAQTVDDNLYYGTALFFKFVAERDKGLNPARDLLITADRLFKEVYTASPNNASAYLWDGRVLYLLDDYTGHQGAMITPYEMYIRIQEGSSAPQTVGIRKSLVESYNVIAGFALNKNEKEKARTYWKKSLMLDPENALALAGIKSAGAKVKR